MSIDVEYELRLVRTRVQQIASIRAAEALVRMDKRWPSLIQPGLRPLTMMEAFGMLARGFNDAIAEAGRQFQRGYTAKDRGGL